MAQQVFVISDLHLGGTPGFQICGPEGQDLLAKFVAWVTRQHRKDCEAHLVIDGDIVDFLAEEPYRAFTADEAEATRKLERILASTQPVWDALRAHARAGAPLTLLLGNHDQELALPGPRRVLLDRLGHGRTEFIHDAEALRLGELLIEHGNRYDDWNWVNHDALLHLRRELSRGVPAGELSYDAPAGSHLVIDVMNPLKQEFTFVDLLKPEDATMPPFLALFRPGLGANLKTIKGLAKQALAAKLRSEGLDPDGSRGRNAESEIDRLMALAEAMDSDSATWLAGENAAEKRGGVWDTLCLLFGKRTKEQRVYLEKLLTVLREKHGDEAQAFSLDLEAEGYLEAVRASAQRGFKVIVYGHTHLVKHVTQDLDGATYLNSGTWADLMRVPTRIMQEATPDEAALQELEQFAGDIRDKEKVGRWRAQVPTFARVVLTDQLKIAHDGAGVYWFREGASLDQMRIPPGTQDIWTLMP